MRMRRLLAPAALLALAGCAVSDDPAAGGFYSGVAGIAGGGYEARVAEREAGVAAAQREGAALSAELARLTGEHEALKDRLVLQRAALRSEGVRLTPASEARLQAAIASEPGGADPAARAAALSAAIADARALSDELAELGA